MQGRYFLNDVYAATLEYRGTPVLTFKSSANIYAYFLGSFENKITP